MSKVITAIIVIVLILSLGIAEQVFIHNTFNDLVEQVNVIQYEISGENYGEATRLTSELLEWWKKKRDILELTSPHNEVKDHINLIAQLKGQLESEMYEDAFATSIIVKEDAINKLNILSYKAKNVL